MQNSPTSSRPSGGTASGGVPPPVTEGGARGWAFAVALAVAAAGFGSDQVPTLATIVADGRMEDWAGVLSNPRNVTFDGDGSSGSCLSSPDRDCPVSSMSRDIRRFAWTYDDTHLAFFIERYGGSVELGTFFVLLDVDRDGLMEMGEPSVLVILDPSTGEVRASVYDYDPFDPNGDRMADGFGFADGHDTLQEGVGGSLSYPGQLVAGGSPDSERMEAKIPWAGLGLAGPTALDFHAGSLCCQGSGADDNLGGSDDRVGTTAFHDALLAPERDGAWPAGTSILYPHDLTNTGNLTDSWSLATVSSNGFEIRLWTDPDGDGDPSDGALLAVDGKGDGDYAGAGDQIPGDLDGDGWPEIGPLAPGETASLIVEIVPGGGDSRFYETTRLVASSLASPDCTTFVEDTASAGDITLSPRWDLLVEGGVTARLPQVIRNHMAQPTCIDFSWISNLGWNYVPWTDPDGDGNPSDGAWLTDDCGGPGADVLLAAGGSAALVWTAVVPPTAAIGDVEVLTLTADSDRGGSTEAVAVHSLQVSELFTLEPEYRIADGTARSAGAGRTLLLPHRLRNAGAEAADFLLSAVPPPGHGVTIYTDPNGDGLPSDGATVPDLGSLGPVAPWGGTAALVIALEVAEGTPPDTVLATSLAADLGTDPTVSRSVLDEAKVSRIAGYVDPGHLLQEVLYPRCSNIFALATGLLPAQAGRYRMRWVELAGMTTLRTTPFTSDARGEGIDILALSLTGTTGAHVLLLEEWDGVQWSELDRFGFEVSEAWDMLVLQPDAPWKPLSGEDLEVTTVFENAGSQEVRGMLLAHVVLDAAENLYLAPDGTFVPYTGVEWTSTAGPWDLGPGASRGYVFRVGPVSWPEPGLYTLRAATLDACGNVIATRETTIEASGDRDGDGWLDAEEAFHGTDPDDRDTDDDGLLDPQDGAGDADGDGIIDARECDADADLLLDSIEAGLDGTALDPDTDLTAGCFQPDADGGVTTTGVRSADTDGGGELDGDEDLNLNGSIDPGEKDPNQAADDPCPWTAPGEVPDLEVSRDGADLRLRWGDLGPTQGPCLTYEILKARDVVPDGIGRFVVQEAGLPDSDHLLPGGALEGRILFWLVRARGAVGGPGPLGHFLR